MKTGSKVTIVVLAAVVILLIVLLMMEATSGPVFRAADYDSFAECVAGIPVEWLPGSLDRDGAEAACMYEHRSPR